MLNTNDEVKHTQQFFFYKKLAILCYFAWKFVHPDTWLMPSMGTVPC